MTFARLAVVFSLGFFALVAQTLLFRDFLTAFEGNELGIGSFFGSWLVWVALGAVFGRGASRLAHRFEPLTLLYVPAFVLQYYLITNARALARVPAYELFPFAGMVALSLLTNAPVSFMTGFLFTLACKWWAGYADRAGEGPRLPVASIYIVETLGGFAGGVVVTLLLTSGTTAELVFVLASLVLTASVAAAWRAGPLRVAPALVVLAALLGGFGGWWAEVNGRTAWGRLLPEEAYQGRFISAQARYLYGEREGQFTVLSSGGVCEALPSTEHASEVAALNLAQNTQAKDILVVGPGSLAVCMRFFELPQVERVTWLHPDTDYPRMLLDVLPERFASAIHKLEVPGLDVRRFVGETAHAYDIAILNLPDATTLVLNRYFTREFFSLVKDILAENGVVSLRISGAANYMGGELALLGGSALETLESVFKHVVLKPGDESWLIASDGVYLSEAPALLRDRFAGIAGVAALYPPEGLLSLYLPDRTKFQMDKYREAAAATAGELLVNTDARPKALFYALLITLRQAGVRALAENAPVLLAGGVWVCVCLVLLYGILRLVYLLNIGRGLGHLSLFDSYFLILSTGLAGMALSIVLMFRYQVWFGSLFLHIGLIAALFMLGSFFGGLSSEQLLVRRKDEPRYLLPVCLLIHLMLVLTVLLVPPRAPQTCYGFLFALCGFFTGVYFPIAAHRMRTARRSAEASGSMLEMLDHAGGAAGAALTGLLILPVFGSSATLGILALLIGVNFLPCLAPARTRLVADRFDKVMKPAGYAMFGVGAFLLIASQIVAAAQAGQEGVRLMDAARTMLDSAELREERAHLDDGSALTYFSPPGSPGTAAAFVFSSAPFAGGISGYAGPITLAIRMDQKGILHDFQILHSNETPAYLKLLLSWKEKLLDRSMVEGNLLKNVDAVSGATLTSDAILRTLEASGSEFASQVLGMDVKGPAPAPVSRLPDRNFMCLTLLTVGAIALRLRMRKWQRRLFLLASVLVAGVLLNLQYSAQHVFSLLSLRIPDVRLSGPFFVIILVPAVVLLVGNVYCGYICPFGALQELIGDLRPRRLATDPDKRIWRYGRVVKYVLLLLLTALFGLTRDYTVLTADPLITFFSAARGQATLWMGLGVLALSLVYNRFWCRNLCPAGAFLSLLNGAKILRKLVPTSRPHLCDLGVRTIKDLDCLSCDRCRHEKG